jgi:hypothetical protein
LVGRGTGRQVGQRPALVRRLNTLRIPSVGDNPVVADLKFPVLALSGPTIFVRRDVEHLLTCGEVALTNGYFSQLQLIDSELNEYPVTGVVKVANVGLFGGWRPFYASRKIRVTLTLGTPRRISLDDAKDSVIATMNQDREFWESAGDLDEQAVEIRALDSFADLVQRMA